LVIFNEKDGQYGGKSIFLKGQVIVSPFLNIFIYKNSMKSTSIFLLIFLFFGKIAAQNFHADSLNLFFEKIAAHQNGIPGFGVAVLKNDKIEYAHGFGFANLEQKLPYSTTTIQCVGSISKTFIGVSLMKCVELGLFSLDSPINDLLPFEVSNPRFSTQKITIRHLATHTSGILDRTKIYEKQNYVLQNRTTSLPKWQLFAFRKSKKNRNMLLGTFLENYFSKKGKWFSPKNFTEFAPGESYEYTNLGAALAAYIIELKTGKSFADFTAENIFKPLEMTHSSWSLETTDLAKKARGYDKKRRFYPLYSCVTYPDGFLHTSIEDLSKYLLAMKKGYFGQSNLLKKASFAELFRPQFSVEKPPKNISKREPNSGIFWTFSKNEQIGHTGGDPGVSTFMFFDPKTGNGRILVINADLDNTKWATDFKMIWAKLETGI
jgi:CubicO group peptidase (beta-lactamase class C family)